MLQRKSATLPAICNGHGDGDMFSLLDPYYGLYTFKVNGKVAYAPCF